MCTKHAHSDDIIQKWCCHVGGVTTGCSSLEAKLYGKKPTEFTWKLEHHCVMSLTWWNHFQVISLHRGHCTGYPLFGGRLSTASLLASGWEPPAKLAGTWEPYSPYAAWVRQWRAPPPLPYSSLPSPAAWVSGSVVSRGDHGGGDFRAVAGTVDCGALREQHNCLR